MGWLYSWGRSLFDELKRIHVRASKIIYGLDWYKPSDKVLVLSKWPSVKGLCEYRLFMLAHDCFYSFFPVPIMKLFPKYELPFVTKTKYWNSSQVTKSYVFGILVTTVRVQSQAKAYLKIFLNAELHGNRLVYKQIIIFF